MDYSQNIRAEKVVGKRSLKGQPIDYPCELGYHCPVCKYEPEVGGNFDERLEWSEYEGFIWCSVCNKDYPSALCQPDIDKSIGIYLDCIEDTVKRVASGRLVYDICEPLISGDK